MSFAAADTVIAETEASGFDPREVLAELEIPILWLFGDLDNSIPTNKSIAVLQSLGGSNEPILYAGYGHMLIGQGEGWLYDIAPQSWEDINRWLEGVVPHL